ncbi:MAG: DMT family transporter [Planctomycetota bacterium]|nr:DMT family transporter [Planctomycetota bacterium]
MGIGANAGLAAAAIWAASSLLYSMARMTAWELNYWKNTIASVIFLVHLTVVRVFLEPGPVFQAPWQAWLWLGLSSLLGIVVGDTIYLRSLQILGARRAVVVATVAPIFGLMIGWSVMGDAMTLSLLAGVGLTVFGVGVVVSDKKAELEKPNVFPGNFRVGVLLGVGAAFCQALSVALAKIGMNQGCEALESSFIRIVVAAGAMSFGCVCFPKTFGSFWKSNSPLTNPKVLEPAVKASRSESIVSPIWKPLTDRQSMGYFIPAVFMGTWIGIWLFQIAQQYSETAVVTTLVSTCPIFAIPMVWLVQGHRVSSKGFWGTGLAVAGVYLVVIYASN